MWGPPGTLGLFCSLASITLDIHLEDGRVVDQPVDGGQRHGRVGEDRVPGAEGLIGGDQHGTPLVARADEFEEHAGLGLILGDIGDVVEDQQVELVELRNGAFESEIAACLLEFLDQIGGAGEEHTVAIFHQRQPDGRTEMRLADPRRAEQQDIVALADPTVAGCDGAHMRLGHHGDSGEVERLEGLAGQQAGLGEMALDPAPIAFGQFMFHQGAEQAGGGPAFLVGLLSEAWPERLDGRQAQLVQGKGETGGVNVGGCHAAASSAIGVLPRRRS